MATGKRRVEVRASSYETLEIPFDRIRNALDPGTDLTVELLNEGLELVIGRPEDDEGWIALSIDPRKTLWPQWNLGSGKLAQLLEFDLGHPSQEAVASLLLDRLGVHPLLLETDPQDKHGKRWTLWLGNEAIDRGRIMDGPPRSGTLSVLIPGRR
ncbi:hypothetical protein GCM10023081_06390 [Arthrobacter ginkgonis]|uniref:Uncharacterized protein n=1 Tax=Arthrobacter ginkgonis TaxID=1630594 RepID=A0ABP7BWN4_9MICC